ncbi:MAG: hypothetical protein ABI863_21850 [Ginsengibacter sp.]
MSTILGQTTDVQQSAVFGRNDSTATASPPSGSGVFGLTVTDKGVGVFGANNNPNTGRGVQGNGAEAGVGGFSDSGVGVVAYSNKGNGLLSTTNAEAQSAVFASNNGTGNAPVGGAPAGNGVFGLTFVNGGTGVFGANNSSKGRGVQGNGPEAGVGGFSDAGTGVLGQSNKASGIVGTSANGQGITAFSDNDTGIFAQGATFAGVFNGALVVSKGPDPKDTTKPASNINGSIVINDGNLFINKGDVFLGGADCAEEFDVVGMENIESGTVMVIDEEGGALGISSQPYDTKVAGVVSGAGSYKSGIVLDRRQEETCSKNRTPIALVGKVYCKVDAQYGAIRVGDLLTTSSTPGHAMKATDPLKAFGTVIGKALKSLTSGKDLIPVLISLQ